MAQNNENGMKNQNPAPKVPSSPSSQPDKISGTGEDLHSPKTPKKKFLFFGIAGCVLMTGGLGAGAYWDLIPIPLLSKKPKAVAVALPLVGPMFKLPSLVINLNEENKRHFLKTTIVLEVGKSEWLEEVKGKTYLLADLAISTLCDKRLEDLEQANSKEIIRKELLEKIDQSLTGGKIKKIYFDEFLYQ